MLCDVICKACVAGMGFGDVSGCRGLDGTEYPNESTPSSLLTYVYTRVFRLDGVDSFRVFRGSVQCL